MDTCGIVLIVDQKWRDLPGLAALACCLKEQWGISAKLIPYAQWRSALRYDRPQAIAVTHMNGSRSRKIRDAALACGTRVVVIQTEGRPNNMEVLDYAVGQGADTHGVDLWLAWSSTVRDFMIARNKLPADKIVVAGSLRFDFYRSPLNQLLKTRQQFAQEYGLNAQQPIITWATNFTCTKYHGPRAAFHREDWRDLGLSKWPSYKDPAAFAHNDFFAREQSLNTMQSVLRARPTYQLVIKPHPTEEHDRYRQFVEECRAEFGPRVVFVPYEYIWNVLNASQAHIHRLCTTGVEAWFLNVPSIELHLVDFAGWSINSQGAAADALAGSHLAQCQDTLTTHIDYYLNGGQTPPALLQARERYVEKWLHAIDGRRIPEHARHLAHLLRERRAVKRYPLSVGFVKNTLHAAVKRLQRTNVDALQQVDTRVTSKDVALWSQTVHSLSPYQGHVGT